MSETPARRPGPRRPGPLTLAFAVGLCLLLPLLVVGEINGTLGGIELRLRYKEAFRGLAIAWLILRLVPAGRAALPYVPGRSDLPVVLFACAAALSVALGGGHWGSVRNLFGAIGLGLLVRSLLAPAERRWWFLHYLGAAILLMIGRELLTVPNLLPLVELNRYRLVTANPNVLGFVFAMTSPIFLAETLASTGRRRGLAFAYTAAAVLGVLLTFSRTAALGMAAGGIVIVLAEHYRRRAIVIGLVLLVAFLAVLRPDIWAATRAGGDRDRIRMAHTSLTLAAEAPVLGIGFGSNNLERRFPDRYEELYGERVFRYHSSNQIVDLLVGTGILGTLLAFWWWKRLGHAVLGLRRGLAIPVRRRATGNVAALAAIAVMSLVEPPLYQGKVVPLLFMLLAYAELRPPTDDAASEQVSRG